MSLLQHQDFVLYRIRNRYLQCMKDGVGERLISINPAALNVPAFKNAGWGSPSEIRRTYSPPIPVGAETEYFTNNPPRSIRDSPIPPPIGGIGLGDDGLMTGGLASHFSTESTEIAVAKTKGESAKGGRREREMHREEDDSSDMSDDSDDDDNSTAPSTRIQFDFPKKELPTKKDHRPRSGSSPIRSGPQVLVTSPSKSRTRRLRGGSHGDVDFVRSMHTALPGLQDVDRLPAADEELLSSGLVSEAEKLHARITDRLRSSPNSSLPRDDGFGDDTGDDSDASTSLSSDFTETADSNPAVIGIGNSLSSSIRRPVAQPQSPAVLHALPPPIRPVSQVQPISALTQLLKAKEREAANPMEAYRLFSGKGELTPVTLKLYIPYSRSKSPVEVIINRLPKQQEGDRNRETTIAEAIGFTLYKYIEDRKEPVLKPELCDINQWTFRMVDDGEPDEDLRPLERTHPVTAYIVKKTGRGRMGAREMKLEGEFALVEATPEQYLENERATPNKNPPTKKAPSIAASVPPGTATSTDTPVPPTPGLFSPLPPTSTKTGPSKIIRIHISTIDEFAQSVSVCVTSDTFIGEVLEQVCRKKHLDKSKYILRLTGHPNVIWPLEKTVAALGDRAELDLVKKKILVGGGGGGGEERPVSPAAAVESGSGSASASMGAMAAIMASSRTPKRGKFLQPVTWAPDMISSKDYLKFTVWRKASMSFMSRHERILAIDGEYVHIMPSEQEQKTLFETNSKTTSIHISTIIGCKTYRKQPSLFKIVVLRPQREMKRYDFEAVSSEQAMELVGALRKGMGRFGMGGE